MSYDDAIYFLHGLRMFGARLGLENTLALAALAGDPHRQLRFIHVAGTNGKGSTCAMLESIYRQAGLRVGLFTSPHLVSFTERLQIDRRRIPEEDFARLVAELRPLAARLPAEAPATLFEFATVMALQYFAREHCDLVIWETGLGGRLDATNIVSPLASVITNIDFDHQEWLGDTLDKIAAEKAGIIKPGVPVITAAEPGRGLEVIAETAHRLHSPFFTVSLASHRPALSTGDISSLAVEELLAALGFPTPGGRPTLALAGEHQRLNAALALATVRVLAAQIPVSEASLREGMSQLSWPGRMQRARSPSGQHVLLDGAHNAASAAALRRAVMEEFGDRRPALVLGVLADKDWESVAFTLAPLSRRILLVPVASQRSLAPEQLVAACRGANPDAHIEACASLIDGLCRSLDEPFVLITGSLYLVGEAMKLLRLSPDGVPDERTLNEWGGGQAGNR